MLRFAITMFIVALVAAVLGFGGIAGAATELARIAFFVFLILAAISLIMGRSTRISVAIARGRPRTSSCRRSARQAHPHR
jgi:uncharacterized membrane protein YtjA (UPF0391 family)